MKRTPLKRKVSLRDSMRKKLKLQSTKLSFARNRVTKLKPLKKLSRSKRNAYRAYLTQTKVFLSQPEHMDCQVCVRLRERGDDILLQPSTEIHHARGRIGRLLCDERFWIPSCRGHRLWPHEHPAEARALGLLSSAAEWNVFPGDGNESNKM